MPRAAWAVLLVLVLAAAVGADTAAGSGCVPGVPAYFYPGSAQTWWAELARLQHGSVVVMNPHSGPGPAKDPRYVHEVEPLADRGVVVYGYVDTAYAGRDPDLVLADVSRYLDWYPVRGIFLDQSASGAEAVPYYRDLARRIRHLGLAVALNPGQPVVDPAYLDLADHVVLFEGPLRTFSAPGFPDPPPGTPASKVWHLVYDVRSEKDMSETVRLARLRGAGVVFVTDGVMPNPWDRLPAYWAREAALIEAGCAP